jgi:hypothetical protein
MLTKIFTGVLVAAFCAAIGRGIVFAFGLDLKVARLINIAATSTNLSAIAWTLAGLVGLAAVASWELFGVSERLRAALGALPPEVEAVRDGLRMNGPPMLGITVDQSGHLSSAQVQLNLTNGAHRALSYTVHRFRGAIQGMEMPDVEEPNFGGEIVPGEPRTYNGGKAQVDIAGGPFNGEAEWEIHYGRPGNEPFVFARRVTFTGIYNPETRRGEDIRWTWQPVDRP